MKKRYTIDDISLFFNQFKQLPQYYELEKVHQLIYNPGAITKLKGKTDFTHLKFIIVTSTIITCVLFLLFWIALHNDHTPVSNTTAISQKTVTEVKIPTEKKTAKSLPLADHNQQNNTQEQDIVMADTSVSPWDSAKTSPAHENKGSSVNINKNNNCSWPKDTVIDKRRLFVYLTNDELQKLGVFISKRRLYYNNKNKGWSLAHMINTKKDTLRFTAYNFFLVYVSDTACTTHRWGHQFYNNIDILVPVIAKVSNKLKILWFNSNNSFFNALPDRYHYLQPIYQQLKCVRRRNPGHRIVNYCDPKKNLVLDSIPYLRLTKEELQNIGVGLYKDSIILIDTSQTFRYKLRRNSGSFGTKTKKGVTAPEIPNMFPAMITDTKGLNLASFGRWAKKQKQKNNQCSSDVFNTLIPVKLPVSDFIKNRKYSLILWYYPTSEFLKALPKQYGNDIKSEIDYINSGEKTGQTSCTYFEACKSTLVLDDVKIFPNPASIESTLEFNLSVDVTGKISLVNISGSELKLLVPQTRFLTGYNSYALNLGEVPSGIYLVSIITDKGFKTQRIIISR